MFSVPAETHCTQDGPSPTTGPPSPSPPLVPTNPTVSKYNVTGNNGTCLLASMALQLNITYLKKDNKVGREDGCFYSSKECGAALCSLVYTASVVQIESGSAGLCPPALMSTLLSPGLHLSEWAVAYLLPMKAQDAS